MASPVTLDALQLSVVGRIFDYLLTLDLEIKFIWKSKFNLMKMMYFINRYTTIVNFILICVGWTTTDVTICPGLMKAEGDTFAMRTYVIWQKRKIVWIPLCIFYIGTLFYNFFSYFSMLNQARYFLLPPFNGCFAKLPPADFTVWVLDLLFLTSYDTAMVILVGWAAIDMWRSDTKVRSDLFRVLFCEADRPPIKGVLFYIYMLAFSAAALATVSIHVTLCEVNSCLQSRPSHPRDGSSSSGMSYINLETW
ncbi:hypothetical protein AGABI1DRAFT_107656 [Agaricus bisporus var. burnettii JB137-S8]|uniref:DUF6533 domain-containing protein n=1 Tax=Agaricus bisporus var. burnettii (strain JB137-S8 / ATCC MYA-4627 / FGSC 10392) TaxID=597362 RepID=K5XTV9_AGABU|nr:uncharacterized protein AGABI1DRAFT_107656 [Agaricus bisporus var. burnettii JB137-S8]EKM78490.1 hypothetical protein AGABI1DRAFT_107656 [Agaricus bisporus var. burnettii JB137-S8]